MNAITGELRAQHPVATCVQAITLLGSQITAVQTLRGEEGSLTFDIAARVIAIQLPAVDSGVELALLLRHDNEPDPSFRDEFVTLSEITLLTVNGVDFTASVPASPVPRRARFPAIPRARRGALLPPSRGGLGSDTASTR